MRIAVFHEDCGDPGGANTYRNRLSTLLRERGHEVFLFSYRGGKDSANDPRVTIFKPDGRRTVGGRLAQHLLPNRSVYRAVRGWLNELEPDILHIHTNYAFMSSVLLGCGGITPAVQTVHDFRMVCPTERGVTPSGRLCGGAVSWACVSDRCITTKRYALEVFTRKIHHYLHRRAIYRIIAPSRALRDAFDREGLPAVHIPHYADTRRCDYQPMPSGENIVLFVGYLHWSKGVGLLLLAFRAVLEAVPSARLVIAGDGPMMDELQEYRGSLGLGDEVTFLGAIPEEEVNRWYRKSTMAVLPSIIYENSPLTVYEAMACGRAVVGTRIGGIPELVVESETGLLFDRNEPADLAAKIVTLLQNRELAEKMGREGRKRAESVFTVDRHLDAIMKLYEEAKRMGA